MALRTQVADLILLDNEVPLGGLRTARILRLHGRYNSIPVILSLPPDREKARDTIQRGHEAGLGFFLAKPFSSTALQQKLGDALDAGQVEPPTEPQIREEIRKLSNLPAMPAAHSKLLVLLSKVDGEIDLRQVSDILGQDPALSAKVMRTSHSAYYGFQGNIVSQAVVFLGAATIRKIVQSAVIYSVFGSEKAGVAKLSFSMKDLWRHSLTVGVGMEVIGKEDRKRTHFLLGVMHDIGKAVFLFRFSDYYAQVLELVEVEKISILAAERELLGITHADCGGELALAWDLPGEVRAVILAHHRPRETNQHKRLAAMVHICDIAARTMNIGFAGDRLIPEVDPYAQRLHKSVAEIVSQKEEIRAEVDSILGPEDDEDE